MPSNDKEGHAWRTRDGIALITQVLGNAIEGRPVLLRARHGGAVVAILESARNEWCWNTYLVTDTAACSPQACLEALVPQDVRATAQGQLLELIAGEELRDAVIIVEVAPVAFKSWLAFAGTFASARRAFNGPAAGLVLLTPDLASAPSNCIALADDGVVDVLDALLFIRDHSNWPRNLLAQAAASVLVEVCRGELDLIQRLIDLSPDQALNPSDAIRALGPSSNERLMHWRSQAEPCPIWLLTNDFGRLTQRVLRGQLGVLFPWLEEMRSVIARRGAKVLPDGLEDKVTGDRLSVLDYEFAHIVVAMSRMGARSSQIDAAIKLRDARNDLAHGRPLGPRMLAEVEVAARTLRVSFAG